MKKKITGLALFALCIFLFATVRNLSYIAKSQASNDQVSSFQTSSMLDLIKGNMSMIAFGPGSGGGRGPEITICEILDA